MIGRALATACVAAAALLAADYGEMTPPLPPLESAAVVLAFGEAKDVQ